MARTLSVRLGYDVPMLAEIPLDPQLRAGGDDGVPVVIGAPDQPAARALDAIAEHLTHRGIGLLNKKLNLSPV